MSDVISVIILAILLAIYVFMIAPSARKLEPELMRNYAHRGLHGEGIPENSLAAFRLAAERGYGIELDVQLSRDGEVYVFHDYTLERMTGREGKLAELTSLELDELRLNGSEEKIPRLSEVLEVVGGRVPILVELKGEAVDTSLCPRVDEILSRYEGKYLVESFNPALLGWYRRNRPEVRRGQLWTDVIREKKPSVLNFALTAMLTNCLSRPDFVAYDRRYARAWPLFAVTRILGAGRFVWTVREAREMRVDCAIFEGVEA